MCPKGTGADNLLMFALFGLLEVPVPPKVCRIMAFQATFRCFELLNYLFLLEVGIIAGAVRCSDLCIRK